MRTLAISLVLLLGICAAQDVPLGDVARRDRARQEAVEAANFKPGNAPPLALAGESVPAHFLTITGEAGEGQFSVKMNGHIIFQNSYVRDLPIYVSPLLLDGGNEMEISLTSGKSPIDITVEERRPHDSQVLARFHSDGGGEAVTRQVRFIAHPRTSPPVELTGADRTAISQVVKSFYDALQRKDGKEVLALFQPAIDDARVLYPEGADFGEKQMTRMVSIVAMEGFSMQPFDPAALEMSAHGAIVMVKRAGGSPVFTSNDVALPNGNQTRVRADTIQAKKIQGQWRLTLPFGF